MNRIVKYLKRLMTLDRHPILFPLVSDIIIPLGLFNNRGRFKPGDKVKYNFFAKIVIGGIEEIKGGKKGSVYTFKDYEIWSQSKSNCVLEEDSGCDVFWLRKLYPWERWLLNREHSSKSRTN